MTERHDFTHTANDTFKRQIEWTEPDGTAVDLTGYTVAMQVRDRPGGTVWASSTGASPSLTITVATPANGTMVIYGTVSQTSPAVGVWDLQVTSSGGEVSTLVAGSFTVVAEVTA
jgi:hypothetical protein